MAVKYVVIDLSKIDPNQLSQLLTEAYEAGYKAGKENIGKIADVPSVPYYGDNWSTLATCTAANTIDANNVSIRSTGISLGADTSSLIDKIDTLSSAISTIDVSN